MFTVPYLLLWPALVLVLGGDPGWIEGWMFALWFLAFTTTTLIWLHRHDPELLAERYRMPGTGGQSRRDLVTVGLIVAGFLAWIVLMPLDGHRFHGSSRFPLWLELAGAACLGVASLLIFRAFADNSFASPLVRVQTERGQRVVSSGVYGFVRHPMYLGAMFMFVGGPLVTGARWGLVAAVAMMIVLAFRIGDEERTLIRDLPGYADYRTKVRYRLLPHVW